MKNTFLALLITSVLLIIWVYWRTQYRHGSNVFIPYQTIFPNVFYIKQSTILPKPITCSGGSYITIIVTSYVNHVELRSAHRRAMPQDYLDQYNATRIFLLAQIPANERYITQEAIIDESNTFGDILQGEFVENYRNLTYKHLMGLHWAGTYCYNSTYVVKLDDDIVFNLDGTYKLLQTLNNIDRNNFLMGYMMNGTYPKRNKQNKWFVTREEYERSFYPTYLSGWYYITTPQTANRLIKTAQHHNNFWIDDILVTGILTEALRMPLKQLPDEFWLEYYELLECCIRDMIVKKIECTYIVGPNGGRNNLILEFNEALKLCKNTSTCVKRSVYRPLKKDCVAYKDRAIFSNGKPKIEVLKL